MRQEARHLVLALAATALIAGCKGPVVQSPLVGQTLYLCCNLHYEKTTISDVNYQQGILVPLGTPVQVIEVRKNQVVFEPAGSPRLTLKYELGPKAGVPFETYLERLFVTEDPRPRLMVRPRVPPPVRGKKGKKPAPSAAPTPTAVGKLIESGTVEPGMTREQVLMALGYPPAHRTPSLDAPEWRYWRNRWSQFAVVFEGDKVDRVQE